MTYLEPVICHFKVFFLPDIKVKTLSVTFNRIIFTTTALSKFIKAPLEKI